MASYSVTGFSMPLSSKAPASTTRNPDRRDVLQNVFPEEHLIRPRLRRDARCDVDRAAEVVALLVDHRPRVHADMGRRQAGRPDTVQDLERRHHRVLRILEVEEHPVAEHLDDGARVPRCDLD